MTSHKPNASAERIRQEKINTSTLADVLDGLGHYGVLSSRLRRVAGHPKGFVGQAHTVAWAPVRKSHAITEPLASTWHQVRDFLVPELTDGIGKVYVAGGGPLITEAALAGGLSATYFEEMGFEGLLLGGAIRDVNALASLALPIVASNFIPTDTQGSYLVLETGGTCVIDNLIIHTGDWIVSDQNGTVAIPDARLNEVVERALAIDKSETNVIARIRRKERLPAIIEELGRI